MKRKPKFCNWSIYTTPTIFLSYILKKIWRNTLIYLYEILFENYIIILFFKYTLYLWADTIIQSEYL